MKLTKYKPIPVPNSIKVNLLKQKFHKIKVIGYLGRFNNTTLWLGRCKCGSLSHYTTNNLTGNLSKQCKYCRNKAFRELRKIHGLSGSRTFYTWQRITTRHRTNVTERWSKFQKFLEDMGEQPKNKYLCRKDRSQPFSTDNCFWGNHSQGKARLIQCNGTIDSILGWANRLRISRQRTYQRLKTMPVEKALAENREYKKPFKYNLEKWNDGKVHVLYYEKDFHTKPLRFLNSIRLSGQKQGLTVKTKCLDDVVLIKVTRKES